MTNSLNPVAIALAVCAAIVAINTAIGTLLFYSANDQETSMLYVQYSVMMNPFGYWLIAMSLAAFATLAQVTADYGSYLYESKKPWVSPTLIYSVAALLILLAIGDLIFQIVVEVMARGQLALASMRQSEYGMQSRMDSVFVMRTFPYNLLQYVIPAGHLLTGVLLIGVARRIGQIRIEVEGGE
jgi:hypothetical protein